MSVSISLNEISGMIRCMNISVRMNLLMSPSGSKNVNMCMSMSVYVCVCVRACVRVCTHIHCRHLRNFCNTTKILNILRYRGGNL